MAQSAPSGDLGPVFDDLEQRLLGLSLEERAAAVAEVGTAAYADVTIAGRLHASVGGAVAVTCLGGHRVSGVVERVGVDCMVIVEGAYRWAVRSMTVTGLEGLSTRSIPDAARPVTARLSFGSVVRGLGEVVVVRVDGSRTAGRVERVGADFVEVQHSAHPVVIPFGAIVAVRGGR